MTPVFHIHINGRRLFASEGFGKRGQKLKLINSASDKYAVALKALDAAIGACRRVNRLDLAAATVAVNAALGGLGYRAIYIPSNLQYAPRITVLPAATTDEGSC
jgi:hypothetical protein